MPRTAHGSAHERVGAPTHQQKCEKSQTWNKVGTPTRMENGKWERSQASGKAHNQVWKSKWMKCNTINHRNQIRRVFKDKNCSRSTRGHNPITADAAFTHARTMSISTARTKVQRESNKNRLVFCTKYNPLGPNIRGILRKHSHLLTESEDAKEIFPDGMLQNVKETWRSYWLGPIHTLLRQMSRMTLEGRGINIVGEMNVILVIISSGRLIALHQVQQGNLIGLEGTLHVIPPMWFTVQLAFNADSKVLVQRRNGSLDWVITKAI